MTKPARRGQIWWVNLGTGASASERKPSLIVQSNLVNEVDEYGRTIIVPMSDEGQEENPWHIPVKPNTVNGLTKPAYVFCEQVYSVPRHRLHGYIGTLDAKAMRQVDENLADVLGLR